nr:MAG TPA: hypothetical protein [Caudoviricetes sp.]
MSVYRVPHYFLEPEKYYLHDRGTHISPGLSTSRFQEFAIEPSHFIVSYERGIVIVYNSIDWGGMAITGTLGEVIEVK